MAGQAKRKTSAHHGESVADLRKRISDLERELERRTAALNDALEQQTATAEVLGVINSSVGNLAPVFDALLEKAARLCGADFGGVFVYDGQHLRASATLGATEAYAEFLSRNPVHVSSRNMHGRLMSGEPFIHIPDVSVAAPYVAGGPMQRAFVDLGRGRTVLGVPLWKDKIFFGELAVYRCEVRPFSETQIALLQNFAAQAVIAIENARLLGELRERTGDLQQSLEYQTATTDVLKVISRSTFDLKTIFEAVVGSAIRLCHADNAGIYLNDGGGAYRRIVGLAVKSPEYDHIESNVRITPGTGTVVGRAVLEGRTVHIEDAWTDPLYEPKEDARIGGVHTMLGVPLLREGTPIGVLALARERVKPFSNPEVQLVTTFADQAVIAIENARLIAETREALDQQTATAEVLSVINSSPGDLAPVFEAMLEKAMRLCETAFGQVFGFNGEQFDLLAVVAPAEFATIARGYPAFRAPPRSALDRHVQGSKVVHIPDVAADPAFAPGSHERARILVEIGKCRSLLSVGLRKDGALLGAISVYRQDVRPFTDKQIALLENFAAQAVIAMENARLITETREALDQQTATAEVLGVINSSPGDVAPVFDAVIENAMRLCEANYGHLYIYGSDLIHATAIRGDSPFVEWQRQRGFHPINRGSPVARALRGERVIHIADATQEDAYKASPSFKELIDRSGIRTGITVALRKDDQFLGTINVYRKEVRPFTEKQVALLENFAAQAVIAMENARLITETREALEQQTATAEVLGVINSSPGDLTPVFEAMLEKAFRLCEGVQGSMWTFDGNRPRLAVARGIPDKFVEILRDEWERRGPSEHHPMSRLMRGERVVQLLDISSSDLYRNKDRAAVAAVELGGVRTLMFVALLKEAAPVGAFIIARREVRAFSEKQVALVQNFAAQAVIAMENARLITETREALEQQTATTEVLQVINSSPGNLDPVFDTMLEKATRLCSAPFGQLAIYDGEVFRFVAAHGEADFALNLRRDPHPPSDGITWLRILSGENVVHIPDARETDLYRNGHLRTREFVDNGGGRALLSVALRKDETLLGVLTIYRQQPQPFSDKQTALLQNFAAQAVIAIENARLITETQEALEQQTATAEVLGVINSSPGDLAPVFDAMLDKALRLCGARFGVMRTWDGTRFYRVACRGPRELAEALPEIVTPAPGSIAERYVRGEKVVAIADLSSDESYRHSIGAQALAPVGGARSYVGVALHKDHKLIGLIAIYRQEVRPFTEKEIALVQNFAAQAVIAIENARLINETREALEQQTATTEVLQVINASPGDLAPVFDAIVTKAVSLCEATLGSLHLYDGESFDPVAVDGERRHAQRLLQQGPFRPPRGALLDRIARGERILHVADVTQDEAYSASHRLRELADISGVRAALSVALEKDERLAGAVTLYRQDIRPFTDKQIALLQNFAAQAVIAMENARLITETREALEQQTATAEVLGVINSSPGDLGPVFNAMLEKATRLCDAALGALSTISDDGLVSHRAFRGPEAAAEFVRALPPVRPGPGTTMRRLIDGEDCVHVLDATTEEVYRRGDRGRRFMVDLAGARTIIGIALRKDRRLLGAITLYRQEVRGFSEKEIALLQNFAAQAVIAMENARLITETREALEQQTATAQVLGVINASPGNLAPVFDAMLEKAMDLCEAAFGQLATFDGERFRTAATRGVPAAFAEYRKDNPPDYGPGTTPARLLNGEHVICTDDLKAEPAYQSGEPNRKALVDIGGARSAVIVALRREDEVLGFIQIYRQEVRPFSDKQITLLENFAAQAVIAMENARLLDEIRQRQAELRVTFDNMGDGVVMFDEHLRLAAWNRNFQEMLDLSDTVLEARPSYVDYLRILAERGEFGSVDVEAELSRRLEHMDQEFRQERTRPDGRVIEVRRNAVPDGGFVLIYSDITERKRSETEIRAARDAAEAAYRDLKATQANLIQAQKMAALGQLTAGIAHEIKNPLNFVNNFAGLSVELLDELKEETAPAIATLDEDKQAEIDDTIEMLTGNLEKIAEHGRRADGIVKSMLEHSRGVTSERRKVDLNNLVEEALNLAYHGARAQDQNFNITLERDYEKGLAEIEIVPQEVNRVFINLIGNGFYAASKRQRESGEASFRPILKVETRDVGEAVEVRIRDNGIGIPTEIKDKLFQPFFTTKPTGEGTGLGLSISYDIVTQQHGGTIEVESEVGEFTEFTVRLPRVYKSVAEAAS